MIAFAHTSSINARSSGLTPDALGGAVKIGGAAFDDAAGCGAAGSVRELGGLASLCLFAGEEGLDAGARTAGPHGTASAAAASGAVALVAEGASGDSALGGPSGTSMAVRLMEIVQPAR